MHTSLFNAKRMRLSAHLYFVIIFLRAIQYLSSISLYLNKDYCCFVVVECEAPASIAHATANPQQSVYVYLNMLTYTCDVGYEITSGDASRTCRETGLWDNTAPNCTSK